MPRAALITLYYAGTDTILGTIHSPDGETFSGSLDLPDGTYSIEATTRIVGEAESLRSSPQTLVVGASTAPTITDPIDWDECKTTSLTVTVQANAGETIRIFVNGVQKDEGTANGSGVYTSASITLDSSDTIGINPVEVITACRVISGDLSHPATVHVPATAGHVAASGVTTHRLLLSSATLLSDFRYRLGGAWDNEIIAPAQAVRQMMRAGNESYIGVVGGLPELHPQSYLGGLLPGYLDSNWVMNHNDRIAVPDTGKTSYHLQLNGEAWPVPPFWFDVAVFAAQAYFRGERTAYAAYKPKILEIISNLSSISTSGIVRNGNQYTHRMCGHGWDVVIGAPVDRGGTWYSSHNGTWGDEEGIQDPIYYGELEGQARYIFALRLFRKMASLESDSATVSTIDSTISSMQSALSAFINGNGALKGRSHPDNGSEGWFATMVAIIADAFATSGQRTAALAYMYGLFNTSYGRTGGECDAAYGDQPLSPANAGTICPEIYGTPPQDVETSVHYAFAGHSGEFAAMLALTNTTAAKTFAEDAVRFSIKWFQKGVLNWLGWSLCDHHGSSNGWEHCASHLSVPTHNAPSWLKEADDRYADLSDIVVDGAQGSEATLRVELGHRIVGIEVVASSACTATLEIISNDDTYVFTTNGISKYSAELAWGGIDWPIAPDYGSDKVMASVSLSAETNVSKTSGVKSYGAYGGGRIKVKVASVTGSPPATFTVTLKQSRITPTFEADETLGFADTFATDRLAEYTAIVGSKSTCSVLTRNDAINGQSWDLTPLKRTMFNTTASGVTALVQTASSFHDGVVMLDKVIRTDATVDSLGTADIYPELFAYLRVSEDGQSFIRVRSGATDYEDWHLQPGGGMDYHYSILRPNIVIEEVVNGSVVATHTPTQRPSHASGTYNPLPYSEMGYDEMYLLAVLEGDTVKCAVWYGGLMVPVTHGAYGIQDNYHIYGKSLYNWGTATLTNATLIAATGRAGFGVTGPCQVDGVRICGMQDQPLPPGFILDTGLDIPATEVILPSCFLTGEYVAPATAKSCLRNEWGARVSDIVTDYNARWSY